MRLRGGMPRLYHQRSPPPPVSQRIVLFFTSQGNAKFPPSSKSVFINFIPMAFPIAHIVLAEKVFGRFFKDKNKKEFFVGTLFPDIRYFKIIEREKTHFRGLFLADLEKETAFNAGLKFHSILDQVREMFIEENDVYSFCPESGQIKRSLKALEDEIFYPLLENWPEYAGYLTEVLPEETAFGVEEKTVKKWHTLIREYLLEPPSEQSRQELFGLGFPNETVREINETVAKIKTDEKVTGILKKMYRNFETLLEK